MFLTKLNRPLQIALYIYIDGKFYGLFQGHP